MSKSLQEQLLKMGLGDAKKAKAINKEKHKERVQAGKKGVGPAQSTLLAEEARQAQIERDRALNAQKKQEAEHKALYAQIKQLAEHSHIDYKGDVGFNFTDGSFIKKLYVRDAIQQQLVKGQVAIVKIDDHYQVVPKLAAERIAQRIPEALLLLNSNEHHIDDDDPYKDFQIPDDLMW